MYRDLKDPSTLVLATRNRGKLAELQALLGEILPDVRVLSPIDVGIYQEIEETGTTFAENALCKARAVAASGYIGVGDDSGLVVDALDGAPGIYSARFAGKHGDDAANNALLLEKMASVDNRNAHFVCCIACVFPSGESFTVLGRADGEILTKPCGTDGFGYDPLFFYPPLGKSFAMLSPSEKNAISHRGRATRRFATVLAAYMNQKEKESIK